MKRNPILSEKWNENPMKKEIFYETEKPIVSESTNLKENVKQPKLKYIEPKSKIKKIELPITESKENEDYKNLLTNVNKPTDPYSDILKDLT